MKQGKAIVEKWYRKLGFPHEYDDEFYQLLKEEQIDENVRPYDYAKNSTNGRKNFLMQLYFLEELSEKYAEKSIPQEIFDSTAQDIVLWTKTWTELRGYLCQEELLWLTHALSFRLFQIGRLQFCMHKADFEDAKNEIMLGENILDVHIPAIGPLYRQQCIDSFIQAKEFFDRYFPEFKYRYFTCHSWLLDETLKKYLPPESNILKFQSLYTPVSQDISDDILRYVFRWDIKRADLARLEAGKGFSEIIRNAALHGEEFHCTRGIIDKGKFN